MHPLWGDPGRLVLPEMYKRPHCFFTPSHYLEMGDTRERWGGKSPYTPRTSWKALFRQRW